MDIDLLSKMVKELILDQDRVVLPGLGSFVAEIVPSTFSDKGYTINPPYRRLYFRSKPDDGDDLTAFYASSNKIAPEMAERIIKDFLADLKSVLLEKKTVVFPGLGRLRATKENHLFFVADEDLDIYPEGFGLEPVSLKTHKETPVQVAAAVEELKSILNDDVQKQEPDCGHELPSEPDPDSEIHESVVDIVVEPEEPEILEVQEVPEASETLETPEESDVPEDLEIAGSENTESENTGSEVPESEDLEMEDTMPVSEPVEDSEPDSESELEDVVEHHHEELEERQKTPVWKIILKVLMWLLIIAVVLLAVYVVLGHTCPDIVDRMLYTPEELEIVKII